jgi:hypothetical protein
MELELRRGERSGNFVPLSRFWNRNLSRRQELGPEQGAGSLSRASGAGSGSELEQEPLREQEHGNLERELLLSGFTSLPIWSDFYLIRFLLACALAARRKF